MLSRQTILSAAVASFLLAGPAHAAPVIEFSTGSAGEGGTIIWDGTNLKGADIPIGAVTISGAPANNGTFLVTEGHLYFDTGSPNVTVQDYYTNLGYNLAIVGCVPELGLDHEYCGLFGSLMLAKIQGWNPTLASQGLLDAFGESFIGSLTVPMGLPDEVGAAAWKFTGFSIATTPLNADGTPGTVSESYIHNLSVIPEPGTMLLLGTGLLAAFQARRHRRP